MDLAKKVQEITEAVVGFRRFFHENAELGMKEFAATKFIVDELRKLPGMEVTDTAPGCIAVLRGKKPGKTLALRADIDALPLVEDSGLPFASKNEKTCHACGHDLHGAVLLGCAIVLHSMADQINGTVKFLFQPAEETLEGAQHLIKAGAMQNPKVDAIFALHAWPFAPVGSIALRSGPTMASADFIDITVTGRAGHAAQPHRSIDSVFIAAHVITALQSIVARETDALDAAVVTLGTIQGGTVRNIIAPEVTMSGTVRTLNPAVRDKIPGQMERIVTNVAEALGGKATLNYVKGSPPVINDEALVELLRASATEAIGSENVRQIPTPVMGGEDFAFYMEQAPGVFFRLGTTNDDPRSHLIAHNPQIIFDEKALPVGVKVMCQTALNYLK